MNRLISFHDLQGLVFGVLMTSLGVVFLEAVGLVTGQTAGLALLLSYLLPFGFGPVFCSHVRSCSSPGSSVDLISPSRLCAL